MSDVKTFVRLPVLLDRELHPVRPLHPKPLSMNEKLRGTSEATMRLAQDEEPPALRSFVRIYTQNGDAGVYRVSSVSRSPATGETTVTLLHGRDVFSDTVILQPELAFSGNAQQLLTYALANQTHFVNDQPLWILGTVANVAVEARTLSYDRASDVISSIESELVDYHFEYDMSGFPWELSLVANSAEVASEFRLSRNLERVSVTVNDADLCNRLILSANHESTTAAAEDGKAAPDAGKTTAVTQYFTYQDLTSINEWGVCVKTADIDVADDLAAGVHTEADAWAAKFLAMRKNPQLQIQLSGLELCRLTGCELDRVRLGMLSRVAIPDHRVWFEERVVSINRQDVLDEPERITVSMANTLPRFSESLARIRQETAANTAAARSSRRSRSVTQKEVTHWEQVVRRTWDAVDGTGLAQLHESGVVVDADQSVKIYSLIQGEQSMLGQLQVNAAAITAEVQRATGAEGTLQANIGIQADRITAEVTRATGAENTLSGRVDVTEAQVGMVVEKKNGENVVKAASIVAAINKDDTSGIALDADKVKITGTTTIADKMLITSDGVFQLKGQIYLGDSTNYVQVNNGKVTANNMQVSNGALTFVRTSGTTGTYTLNMDTLAGMIKNASVADNILTLTKFDGTSLTFSKATTLTGAVDGSMHKITVTATPQGNELEHLITTTGHWGSANTTGEVETTYYGTINATPKGGTTQAVRTFTVDASGIAAAVQQNIGVTGSWSGDTFTAVPASGGAASVSTVLGAITMDGTTWTKGTAGDLVIPVKVVTDETTPKTVKTDNITVGAVAAALTLDTNTANATVTGTIYTKVRGSDFNSTTPTIGYLRNTVAGGNVNNALVVTSALRQKDSDDASGNLTYAKAQTTVNLEKVNTAAAALSGTATSSIGAAKVNANVGSTTHAFSAHTIAVDGGADIATAGGTSDVTFSLDGVVVGRKRVKATYAGDASGNVDLSSMAAGSGNVTYTQDTHGSYVSLPVDYTLSNGTTGTKPVNTVKFPFGVTLTPSKSGSNLAVSATVPGASGTLTVNSGSYAVNNLYTLTEKTAAQLNDASTGNRLDGAVGTVINGNLTYNRAYTGMGWVWAHPAAVSGHTDQMTLTSYLSNATSTSATHFAKKATTIALSADKATLDPGEAATISAKVGTDTYASVAVSARAINLRTGVEVTPSTEAQTINYDGYDGLGTVTVQAAAATGGGTLTAWKWTDSGSSAEENTVSTSIEGTTTTKAIKLVLTQSSSWNADSTKKVYLRDTSSYGNLHASITVNASDVYTTGVTNGYAAGVNDGYQAAIDAQIVPMTTLTATENKTYTPSAPYKGFTSVTVNVQTSGGGGGSTPTTSHDPYAFQFDNYGTNKPSGGIWQTVSPLGSLARYYGFYVKCGDKTVGPYIIKVEKG